MGLKRSLVHSLVALLDFGTGLDLETLVRAHENAEYHPESFPGLTPRLDDPRVTVLLFASGKGYAPERRAWKTRRGQPEKPRCAWERKLKKRAVLFRPPDLP